MTSVRSFDHSNKHMHLCMTSLNWLDVILTLHIIKIWMVCATIPAFTEVIILERCQVLEIVWKLHWTRKDTVDRTGHVYRPSLCKWDSPMSSPTSDRPPGNFHNVCCKRNTWSLATFQSCDINGSSGSKCCKFP